MKIKLKEFQKKCFLIPLTKYGQWANYKQFTAPEWKQNIINVLRMVITASNPLANKAEVTKLAEQQLETFIKTIVENLSPQRPCLALAFAPAQCWFVAFVVEAFLPLENVSENNIFNNKYYAEVEQTIEIVKAKGNPINFALELVNELEV